MNLQEAIQKNELVEYLSGSPRYYEHCEEAYVPTDASKIVKEAGKMIISDEVFKASFLKALIELSIDASRGWLSMLYILDLHYFSRHNKVQLLSAEHVQEIVANISKNKLALEQNKQWLGANFENGIWGYITSFGKVLEDEIGIKILLK